MFKSGNVTIIVNDFNKAVEFYVETLGLNLQYKIEGHLAQVSVPGLTILLIYPNGENGSKQVKSDSVSIGLEVKELDSAVELLKSRGVKFYHFMDSETSRFAYFSDQQGTSLYLVELRKQPNASDI
ncbi:VOC family protein [Clostridium sp. YIM B02505]|uniref:VOC family protein n=1 Tax=Clostridium yunnanense TaxID=2800325 RepID=A0ABS1EV71_9CLOT|nr:VOC family protein [Clostridium yunnanense]MBK1813235.1 VOC family protein [Clostridium yunnanense]